ncbi:MAG: diguanylate cyclase [Clostridiaceae bacterium]|nr:diguanylate cyclase [Clostridiaceae bacterium]
MIERRMSILIVDDNNQNLQVLAGILEGCGYDTGYAMSGMQAIHYVELEKPDLILLDVMMPEMDGYETCVRLKANPDYASIPVIFLTARIDISDIVKGFEAGGQDYITKPFNTAELKSRVKTHLDLKKTRDELLRSIEELRTAKDMIEQQNAKLNAMMASLDKQSRTDSLTGLSNRRCMMDRLMQEEKKKTDPDKPLTLVMGDIDFFKSVNDTYGHLAGDQVLVTIAEIMQSTVQSDDLVCRWGGEEFLILFTDESTAKAADLTEQIRSEVARQVFSTHHANFHLTMTFGIAVHRANDTLDSLINRADQALYEGKRAGRNKIVVS